MRAVRFDDLSTLTEVSEQGFGGWGPGVELDEKTIGEYQLVAGRQPLDGRAPGFLIASLLPRLAPANNWRIEGHASAINLGCPQIRFPTPATPGARLRGRSRLVSARPHARGTVVALEFEARSEDADDVHLLCMVELLYVGARS